MIGILTLKYYRRHLPSLLRLLPMWFPFMSCLTSEIQSSAERHGGLFGRSRDALCSVADWLERLETQLSLWRTPSKVLYLVELRQLRGASDVSPRAAHRSQWQCRGPETARHSARLFGRQSMQQLTKHCYSKTNHEQTTAQRPFVTHWGYLSSVLN